MLAASAVGCREPTEIVVDVTTTADCAAVASAGTQITAASREALRSSSPSTVVRACDNGAIGSLVLVPSGSDVASVAVEVVSAVSGDVTRCDPVNPAANCVVARRLLRYVPHERLRLPITMRASCAGVACASDRTCVEGACVSAVCGALTCDETTLGPVAPGAADGGSPVDAAADAPRDAARDGSATPDAGLTDAGLVIGLVFADDPSAALTFARALGAAANAQFALFDQSADAGTVATQGTMQANSDVALVWSKTTFKDPAALGDAMAGYLESGRQVVLAGNVYLAPNVGGLGGRMRTSYMLIGPGTIDPSPLTPLFIVYSSSSPVLTGVRSLGLTASFPVATAPTNAGAPVAAWQQSNTVYPAVVTGSVLVSGAPRNRVDLNMPGLPASVAAGGWTGDGLALLINALRYR